MPNSLTMVCHKRYVFWFQVSLTECLQHCFSVTLTKTHADSTQALQTHGARVYELKYS